MFNVLLQVLDDGRITDGQGRTVDFKNTVIILTSNIGSQYIMEDLPKEERNRRVTEALRGHFRPEFLIASMRSSFWIALTTAKSPRSSIFSSHGCSSAWKKSHLSATDRRREEVPLKGSYDPAYGARPLRRVIQREILDPLSLRNFGR